MVNCVLVVAMLQTQHLGLHQLLACCEAGYFNNFTLLAAFNILTMKYSKITNEHPKITNQF